MRYTTSRRRTWTWTVVCSCLSMWAASPSWADDAAPASGLTGLLATSAPDGLTEGDFADLTESIDASWKDWSRQTGELVKELYEGKHDTLESQQAAIDALKVKLGTLETALADRRYASIFPQLADLYSKLNPEVQIADAMLKTLSMGSEAARQQRLQPSFEQLSAAVDLVDTDLAGFNNAAQWRTWINLPALKGLTPESANAIEVVQAARDKLAAREKYSPEVQSFTTRESFLRLEDALGAVLNASDEKNILDTAGLRQAYSELLDLLAKYRTEPSVELEAAIRRSLDQLRVKSPDGGVAVGEALGSQFLNYNLRITASEGLLNRFIAETRVEQSAIRERMTEANVYGNQVTTVTTSINLVPNSLAAGFRLNLSGAVRSNANGYASRATIHTVGYHTFNGYKDVTFDGQEFYLGPSMVGARANNQAVGARTKFSGIPIFGHVANNVAIREASERMPQSNAITASRIRQQVSSQLDQQTADQFANASKQLQTKTYGPLRKYDLYPDAMSWSTTHKDLRFAARLMNTTELGGSEPAPIAEVPRNGMVAQIHETVLSHAFDRIGLKGQTLTEDQVRELLESRLTEILGREVKIPKPENAAPVSEQQMNTLVFDEHEPVRFSIDDGVVTLTIRAGLRRENGEDIPPQIISVPFTPTLSGKNIVLTRGNVGVKPITRPPNVAAQVTRAQVMRQKIQSALPEQTIDGVFKVKVENKQVELALVGLAADGGWLTLDLK